MSMLIISGVYLEHCYCLVFFCSFTVFVLLNVFTFYFCIAVLKRYRLFLRQISYCLRFLSVFCIPTSRKLQVWIHAVLMLCKLVDTVPVPIKTVSVKLKEGNCGGRSRLRCLSDEAVSDASLVDCLSL